MANPFQIGDDPDLSFGDEDFLLDSIDLEAIAAKALQTKPYTGPSTTTSKGNSNPVPSIKANKVTSTTQSTKQFIPFSTGNPVDLQNTTNATGPSSVSTPQNRPNKFNFKPKKSPENDQRGAALSRPVLTLVKNPPRLESNNSVSPVSAGPASDTHNLPLRDRFPGGNATSAAQGLRSPIVHPQASHAVQPPMGVTVKRDGTSMISITSKPDQPSFSGQVSQGSSSVNLRTPSAQKHDSRNVLRSSNPCSTANGRVFQRYVPPSEINPPNSQTHTLRSSQSINQTNNPATQLRNPSMSSNVSKTSFAARNHPSSASSSMHGGNSATSQTSLQTNYGPGSTAPHSLRSNSSTYSSSNQPKTPFKQYQGPTNVQNQTGTSQPKNHSYNTTQTNSQFQTRNVSPLQASTPGYRTPNGGPSAGSSRFQGVTTPMQPRGQASRYPTTPRAGASTFSTTGGTPRMRGVGGRPESAQQVPLLTPRVAQLCQTPSGNGSRSTMRTRARKFPGPAGVLPKLKPGHKLDDAVVEDLPSTEKKPEPSLDDSMTSLCSQDSVDEFQRGAWLTMKAELGSSAQSILSSYNIAIVLRKASLKQLPRKQVPNLCVMIRQVTQTGCDACVMVKDPSGEMQGTLHRKIVEDHQVDLKPGSVMVLRKVGVLSPTVRNHYLNITPGNVVQIYPAQSSSMSCSQASPTRSLETHSLINRTPDNIDSQEQSNFTFTKDCSSRSPQDSSHHSEKPSRTHVCDDSDTNSRPAQLRSKILLIEGVNMPERNHQSSSGNLNPKKIKDDHLNLVADMTQLNNTLRNESIEPQDLVGRNQRNKPSPLHLEDSGISLGMFAGETSLPVQETMHEDESSGDNVGNSMSWLRKRQAEPVGIEECADATPQNDVPSKRRCVETANTYISAPKPSLSVPNLLGKEQINSNSEEISKAAEENIASLLDGIEDEFFDDF